MDASENLWLNIFLPFATPLLPNQRIYLVYLISAMVLAFGVYLYRSRSAGAGQSKSFLAYCFPKAVYLHPSALIDYGFYVINKISFAILLAPFIVGSVLVSAWVQEPLSQIWGAAHAGWSAGLAAGVVFTFFMILANDFAVFVGHYLLHKVPLLWEFHKVHHSAEVMTPITVYRMHPVDDMLVGTLSGIMTGLVHGVFVFLYQGGIAEFTVWEINLVLFVFYLLGYNLRHSHIWLPYPAWLSYILISPAQHQIHHSSEPRHFDKNIGFIFAFWDWAAGTLYVPKQKEDFAFGLHGGEHREFNSIWKLYALPFKKAAALLRGRERSEA